MGLSRQEVNLRRLLAKCELLLKSNQEDERFHKYVSSLEEMLHEIIALPSKPLEDNVNEYKRKIYTIKVTLGMDTESDKAFLLNEAQEIRDREELFGLRKRNPAEENTSLGDLDDQIKYHENVHEKIVENMLQLTQNLKEQSQLANQIVRKDTEVVGRSAGLTDINMSNLKAESEKLKDHSSRVCKCWMWIMLLVVFVVFINMVFFMKIMKKN